MKKLAPLYIASGIFKQAITFINTSADSQKYNFKKFFQGLVGLQCYVSFRHTAK